MNPELKEYLDAWFATRHREFDDLMDALRPATRTCPADHAISTPAVDSTCGVVGPVQANCDRTELVPVPATHHGSSSPTNISLETLGVDPSACTGFITTVPATCSTDCVAQTIPVFTAAAASDGTFVDEANGWCDSSKPRPMPWPSWLKTASAPATAPTTPTVDVTPMLAAVPLTVARVLNSEFELPVLLLTESSNAAAVVLPAASVCLPWASTRPWLEHAPLHPPDPWSLFPGARSVSRPKPCAHSPGSNQRISVTLLAHSCQNPRCKVLSTRYPDIGDNCCLLRALEQEKQVSHSAAGHVNHIMLRSDRAENYMLDVPLLPLLLEQEEFSIGFQLQQSIILADWYLGNQSILATARLRYFLKCYLLADKWRSRLLCVGPAHEAVHAFIPPLGKRYRNWQLVHSAMDRGVVISLIQITVLNYMDLWWFATAIFSEIMSIISVGFPVRMDVTWLLTHAHQLGSSDEEQVVRTAHNGSVTIPCAITLYDPIVDWHISMHIQYISIGLMHMIYESLALGNLICIFNSETVMCAWLVGVLIGNGTRIKSEMTNNDISALVASAVIVTRMSHSIKIEWPSLQFQDASSEWLVFIVEFGGEQGTFQGGRHMPVLGRQKEFRLPWDPGGVAAACGQGGFDVITATALDQWLLVPRLSDHQLLGTRMDYYHVPDQLNEHRLQWDPGGFSVTSAWGQAEFQGGRDVRILSYIS